MLGPFVVGVGWFCAETGSRLAALEGEEDGRPAFPVAVVCIDTVGFFVFVAVPVGFDMAAIYPKTGFFRQVACSR